MNDFKVLLKVKHTNEPPVANVHYEWTQYALWVSGRYGFENLDGHEIGLSPELVHDLLEWGDNADAVFNADDPTNSIVPDNFFEDGLNLAKRVRAELPAEWVVTTDDPITRTEVVLPFLE
ncbi:hypothetical protein [Leucobacter sp. 1207-22]|uniref:hypothetical protein n=1 Tax=Leucobacter sp. 1207-22 TaxID=2604456 RepID=UPI004063539B